MAMRIVLEAARLLGAKDLVGMASAHIDGCLYHGDSGVYFAERLVALGARTAVPMRAPWLGYWLPGMLGR
jgi:predicted aconitase